MAHLMFWLDITQLDHEVQSQVLQKGECKESKKRGKNKQRLIEPTLGDGVCDAASTWGIRMLLERITHCQYGAEEETVNGQALKPRAGHLSVKHNLCFPYTSLLRWMRLGHCLRRFHRMLWEARFKFSARFQ